MDEKKRGVLLINLGTPKSPESKYVFRYLTEFLTDERVIDFSWIKRQFLVRGLIIPSRLTQSTTQYKRIWTEKGSPLLFHGESVRNKLQIILGGNYKVILAMRYQSPSIYEALEKIRKECVDELIILPLFPQYASATTGSVFEKVMKELNSWKIFPKMVFINHFFDNPGFIESFCARANQYSLASYDHILFSFHGLPERHIRKGDLSGKCLSNHCCKKMNSSNRMCYRAQCIATAKAIASRLGLVEENYTTCFQSRLGKESWLQPYTSEVMRTCADKNYKKLLVFSPSFVCDCLETIHEISIDYANEFKKMGGEDFQLVEGLNSHPLWIKALEQLIKTA